jgi:hypothetical protein
MGKKIYPTSFAQEIAQGGHDLYTDTLKLALFTAAAALSSATSVYSTTNETSGPGYTAGGVAMTISAGHPVVDGASVLFRYDQVSWPASSLTARFGLVYNATKSNKAVLVLDFGHDRSSLASAFTIAFPVTMPPLIKVGV